MPKFLIRMEATNFAWSCSDTQDLSTIRGGSMLLADAHVLIEEIAGIGTPEVHGASQAIWVIDVPDAQAAEAKRRAIEVALTTHASLKHGTFSVDVVAESGDAALDLQKLRTENRWRQFQRPTLAVPEPVDRPRGSERPYCQMDMVRPCADIIYKGKDRYTVSESVRDRRTYGRDQKKQFYKKTVPPEISGRLLDFANDLSEITSRESWHEDDGQKNLENKMAVIYLDGNKQSEMAAQFGLEKFKAFREYTHDRQKEFLAAVFKDICEDQPGERTSNEWYHWDGRKRWVRFETLLWGGDDILLVVPAWQGWELVRTFFDHVTGNKTGLDAWQFEDAKFTYSAGLVLCSYKASIHRMRKLAEDLLIQGKKQTQHGTHENWLGYEVLESFDVAGEDLEHWRAARLTSDKPIKSDPEGLKKTLLLRPDQIAPVAAMVRAVHDEVEKPEKDISRRKLEAFARTMRTHPIADVQFDKAVEQYLNSVGPFKVCGELTTRQKLHHLAALWDYLA